MPGNECLRQLRDKLGVSIGQIHGFTAVGLQVVEFRLRSVVFAETLPFAVSDCSLIVLKRQEQRVAYAGSRTARDGIQTSRIDTVGNVYSGEFADRRILDAGDQTLGSESESDVTPDPDIPRKRGQSSAIAGRLVKASHTINVLQG